MPMPRCSTKQDTTEPLVTPAKIGVIILAAGASTRMGQPKQLLLHRGQTLLRRAVDTALASICYPVVVVIGAHAELVRKEVAELPVSVVENREWEKGMSSSIRTGLRELMMTRPELDAVVVMLADQPLVTATLIDQIADVSRNTGKRIVASEYGTVLGVPALFSRELFAEITALNANEGARQVIARHREDVATVSFPEAAVDVDTPRDYELLKIQPRIYADKRESAGTPNLSDSRLSAQIRADSPTFTSSPIQQEIECFRKEEQDARRSAL